MSKYRAGGLERVAVDFDNYEDFLDSQITETDLFYLEVFCVLIIAEVG